MNDADARKFPGLVTTKAQRCFRRQAPERLDGKVDGTGKDEADRPHAAAGHTFPHHELGRVVVPDIAFLPIGVSGGVFVPPLHAVDVVPDSPVNGTRGRAVGENYLVDVIKHRGGTLPLKRTISGGVGVVQAAQQLSLSCLFGFGRGPGPGQTSVVCQKIDAAASPTNFGGPPRSPINSVT